MKNREKLRKKKSLKILRAISLLAITGVSLLSYEKTDIYSVRNKISKLNTINAPETANIAETHTNSTQENITLENITREAIEVEPMVATGSNFVSALKQDRNSMDMGK